MRLSEKRMRRALERMGIEAELRREVKPWGQKVWVLKVGDRRYECETLRDCAVVVVYLVAEN